MVSRLQGFRDFLAGLGGPDLSLALALRELIRLADEEGRLERRVWESGLREEAQKDRKSFWAGEGEDRGGGELEGYLEEQVLARLRQAGFVTEEGEKGRILALARPFWEEIRTSRQLVLGEVEGVLARLRATEPPPGRTPPDGPNGSRLWAEGLTKIYRKRRVVDQVAITVRQGEIVGLLGPNGAGKTTTFYMIVGLIPPHEGRVYLDDQDITEVPMYRRARLGVGYLAQEPSVFRKLTVEENILAILQTQRLPKDEERRRLEELLGELSLSHLRHHKAYSLSGGERRRLEITRALVQRPKFMLLDEPFAGIDPIATNDIQQIVRGLKHRGIGAVISDHNVEQTLEIVDRAYIMYEGRIRVSGTVSELVWNDEVAEIYFGPTLTARMRARYPDPRVAA